MNAQGKILASTKKASFWKRLIAYAIDALMIGVICAIVGFILEVSVYPFNFLSYYLYNILMDRYKQGTVGKIITNIKVIGPDGRNPKLLNSIVRNLGKLISSVPLGYGFFIILAPHERQTAHDQLSNCYVVER